MYIYKTRKRLAQTANQSKKLNKWAIASGLPNKYVTSAEITTVAVFTTPLERFLLRRVLLRYVLQNEGMAQNLVSSVRLRLRARDSPVGAVCNGVFVGSMAQHNGRTGGKYQNYFFYL